MTAGSRWGLLLLAVLAAPAGALTLEQAYDAALGHAPGFQAAIQERVAGREFKALGRANLLPTLSYNYSRAKHWSEVEQDAAIGTVSEERDYRSYASTLRLEQPLFDMRAWATHQMDDARAARAELEFEARLQDFVVTLAQAYTDVLLGEQRQRLAAHRVATLTALLAHNQALVDGGEGTRTDVLETRSQLARAEAERIQTADELAVARRRLSALTGLPARGLTAAAEPALPPLERAGLESWREQARRHSPVLGAERQAVRVAEREVARQRAGHLPRVSLYASIRKTDSDSENTFGQTYDTDSVGLQVRLPLYDGGAVSAARRQAAARYGASEYQLAERRDQVLTAVETQWRACTGGLARIDALRRAVADSDALVAATRRSLRGGERNNQDLLEARREAHLARRDLAEARYRYINAWLALHREAGTLTSARLRQVSRALSLSDADPSYPVNRPDMDREVDNQEGNAL